nr:hypothetical protein [Vallicoccus soli]
MDEQDRAALQELLRAYGPVGQEDEVREVARRRLEPSVDRCWQDPAGNVVGLVRGTDPDAPAVRVTAHLDELSMLVKRVEPDGSLHVTPLGTMYPGNFGLGPVAVLGDGRHLPGVLALGSEHTTQETPRVWQTKPDGGDQALDWTHVSVFTGRSPADLADAGVGPGTRVCVDRSKRGLFDVGGFVGSYFLDDRAAVAALLRAARELRGGTRPRADTYLVLSVAEEIGGVGASYACRTLPGDLVVALEVGPAEAEYGTSVHGGPVVGYSDAAGVYDKRVADRLCAAARARGVVAQPAVLGAFESDASHATAAGLSARAGLLCLPTLSTHGYEVMPATAVTDVAAVLVEFLRQPAEREGPV